MYLYLCDGRDILAGRKNNDKILNPLRRKILRRRFSTAELVFGPAFLIVLMLVGVWIVLQKDNYDPGERDIAFAQLQEDSVEDNLYRRPVELWIEPGTMVAGGEPTVDLGILPRSLLADGWQLDGRLESYDAGNLYEKINGAAEQYLAYGFNELKYVTLAQGGDFITLELYDQASFPNVLGLFSAQGGGTRKVEKEGDLFYFTTPAGAIGGYGNYYFKISASTDAGPAVEKAMSMVENLTSLPINAGSVPLPYRLLTGPLNVAFEQIAYIRDNAFQYDFLNEFWFAPLDDGGDARIFLHQAGSADEAAAQFGSLVEEQAYEYELQVNEPERAVLQHEFLKTIFAVGRKGDLIYGVDGAGDPAAADAALARIEEVMTGA
jgi:hypothetical protein